MQREGTMSTQSNLSPTRCQFEGCKKKLGLTAFVCRCKGYYCGIHRPDMAHSCAFDYRAVYKESLSTVMIKMTGSKLETI